MDVIKIEKIDEDSIVDSPNSNYFPTINSLNDLKKKKGPAPSSDELCLVC